MRRPPKESPQKLSSDSLHLASLARALVQAGSRLEERDWESRIDALTERLLKNDRQSTIDAALDHLFKTTPEAYDALVESAETVSICSTIEHEGRHYDAMLIAAPILAWTRFAIASGPISSDTLLTLTAHLYAHVLASEARMVMMPFLFAIDQLPRAHSDVFAMTRRMAQAALAGQAVRAPLNLPETASFLADTRYLLAVVAVPRGAPLFRWQIPDTLVDGLSEKQQVLSQWRAQAQPTIERVLPGCGIELLLPNAYYASCREADKKVRPASIHASVHYLTHTLNVAPGGLSAIIGGFSDQMTGEGRIDEFRISFTLYRQTDVIYGVVWPLYDEEDAGRGLDATPAAGIGERDLIGATAALSPLQEIYNLLRQSGITEIQLHDELFPMEACDDCGAPLYCDRDAELVHAEMPEDVAQITEHFH